MGLTNDQISRYSRHLIMPEVGVEGQEKLINSKVLCIGAGGLGSPLALYLAAAGVGNLGNVSLMLWRKSPLSPKELFQTASMDASSASVIGRRNARVANDRITARA